MFKLGGPLKTRLSMIPLIHNLSAIRKQYVIFIVTIVATIILNQAVIQYDLNKQNEDAKLINLAGRQRVLGQRIAKLTLYINNDLQRNGAIADGRLDTLKKLITHWETVHTSLLHGNSAFGLSDRRSPVIDSLLARTNVHLKPIVEMGHQLIGTPDLETSTRAVDNISLHELPFLHTMEAVVNQYQREAEEKLYTIKLVELALAVLSLIILSAEFFYLFRPIVRKVEQANHELLELNNELTATNEELRASEEELKTNLDFITTLQDEVSIREKQYRGVIDSATDMIYELDESGAFSFTNPMMEKITGFSATQLKSKKYWEVVDDTAAEDVKLFYKKQREQRQEHTYREVPIRSKTGAPVWVGQNVRMWFDNGRVKKVSVVARDITALKEANDRLAESEQRFRILADNAPIGIFQTNNEGLCIYVNKKWCEISGMEEHRALGEGWANAILQEDRASVFERWSESVERDIDFNYEFRLQGSGKGTRLVHSQATRVTLEGEVIGFIGTMNDITELRQAQMKLAESEKLYRELLENALDVTWLLDRRGFVVYTSSSVKNVLNYTSDEVSGRSLYSLIKSDDHTVFDSALDETLEGHAMTHVEIRLRKKNGDWIWIDGTTQPVVDKDGKTSSIQLTTRDITLKKEAEAALQEAKEKAEDATRAKSQFLSMMSHEIRTPMNAIIGLTQLLLQDQPRPDQLDSLNLLKFSGENLLTIINDILDFNKIEAGKITLESIDVDLHAQLTNIIQILRQRAQAKDIKLNFSYDAALPKVFKCDPVRVGQIVTNLIGNAIKFTERGSVELIVGALNIQPHSCKIGFSIKDTGIGIPEDKIQTIFERFSQANEDTTRKFGGTGLGLSITKRLLQLMNSDVTVTSVVGKGSEFTFELTLPRGSEKLTKKTTGDQQTFSSLDVKVLLVEDNRVNQVVATNFLKRWGVEVVIANHGKEALELIVTKEYAVVLMDLQMPEMDGYEASRHIRAMEDPYFTTVPILALTASAMIDVKGKVLAAGMNDFISKPFQPHELYQKLVSFIPQDSSPAELHRQVSANLDLYTEGDPDFKRELAGHLIKNINELKDALREAIANTDVTPFSKAIHKVKTSLAMLGDEKFNALIEKLREDLANGPAGNIQDDTSEFDDLATKIIAGLREEINPTATRQV